MGFILFFLFYIICGLITYVVCLEEGTYWNWQLFLFSLCTGMFFMIVVLFKKIVDYVNELSYEEVKPK